MRIPIAAASRAASALHHIAQLHQHASRWLSRTAVRLEHQAPDAIRECRDCGSPFTVSDQERIDTDARGWVPRTRCRRCLRVRRAERRATKGTR